MPTASFSASPTSGSSSRARSSPERARATAARQRLRSAGATIKSVEDINEYTLSITLTHEGDLKTLADHVESVPDAEVLSAGHALEIVKDLGDARTVAAGYGLDEYTDAVVRAV